MAKFRFIGDPKANGHGPENQELFGVTFYRDEWTDVEGEALIARCERHSHLEPFIGAKDDEDPAAERPKNKGGRPRKDAA